MKHLRALKWNNFIGTDNKQSACIMKLLLDQTTTTAEQESIKLQANRILHIIGCFSRELEEREIDIIVSNHRSMTVLNIQCIIYNLFMAYNSRCRPVCASYLNENEPRSYDMQYYAYAMLATVSFDIFVKGKWKQPRHFDSSRQLHSQRFFILLIKKKKIKNKTNSKYFHMLCAGKYAVSWQRHSHNNSMPCFSCVQGMLCLQYLPSFFFFWVCAVAQRASHVRLIEMWRQWTIDNIHTVTWPLNVGTCIELGLIWSAAHVRWIVGVTPVCQIKTTTYW